MAEIKGVFGAVSTASKGYPQSPDILNLKWKLAGSHQLPNCCRSQRLRQGTMESLRRAGCWFNDAGSFLPSRILVVSTLRTRHNRDTQWIKCLTSGSLTRCLVFRKNFSGTVSHFITGQGKRMVAYRKHDGALVHVCPEPEE